MTDERLSEIGTHLKAMFACVEAGESPQMDWAFDDLATLLSEVIRLRRVLRGLGSASDGDDSTFARWVARQVDRALPEDGTEDAR